MIDTNRERLQEVEDEIRRATAAASTAQAQFQARRAQAAVHLVILQIQEVFQQDFHITAAVVITAV